MTITSEPWPHPDPHQSKLRLVQVPGPVLHALAGGRTASAPKHPFTPYLTGDKRVDLWRMRSKQIADARRMRSG